LPLATWRLTWVGTVTNALLSAVNRPASKLPQVGGPLLALVLVGLAAYLLYRTLGRYQLEDIVNSLTSIPGGRIALAGFFAATSYLCLTGFDWLALRYVDQKLPYRKVALASFCSLSLGHNIGFAALSSGAIRYRFYSRWGIGAGDVAKIILFCGVTVGLGLMILGGCSLILRSDLAAQFLPLSETGAVVLGAACLAAAALYLVLARILRKPLKIRNWTIEMPPLRLALAQVVIGPINFAFVAACLHQTLSGIGDVPYLAVAAVYVIANVTSLISHVPGGLGVIETVVLYLLPGANVIGALIAFRVIYFIIPLCIGGTLFVLTELLLRQKSTQRRKK
jgi:glycosyltransferase 2 family protein